MPYQLQKSKEKIVYIARHGDNLYDQKGISGGNDQPGLTKQGERQVINGPAEEWKDKGIKNIFTSDAVRAKQSAEIIAKAIKAKVIVDKRLETQNIGELAGEKEEDVKPIIKYLNNNHPNMKVGKTGESFNELKSRFEKGYKDNLEKHKGETNAFVLHGDGEKLVRSDFGKDMKEYNIDGIDHGETTEVKQKDDGKSWVIKK